MTVHTYTFRATVFIRVEGEAKGLARKDAEAIRDQIRAGLPTGATLSENLL